MQAIKRILSVLLPTAPEDQPPAAPVGDAPPAPVADGGGAPPETDSEVLQLRARLEAKDKEFQQYKDQEAERIRNEASRMAAEAIPSFLDEPPPTTRVATPEYDPARDGHYRPADGSDPEQPDPAALAHQRIDELETGREMDRLRHDLDGYKQKYPHLDEDRFLRIIAQAGDRRVDEEKLAQILHESEVSKLEAYHQEKLKGIRSAAPPPIPPNPSGVHSPASNDPKVSPSRRLEEGLRARGFARS